MLHVVLCLLLGLAPSAATAEELIEVDLELVLAADRSGSMSPSMRRAQRDGFAAAFRNPDLRNALLSGPIGRVAVVYFEWSDAGDQELIVPWTLLSAPADLDRIADWLDHDEAPSGGGETSISGALLFADALFDQNRFTAYRRVIDVSGNGRNSHGPSMAEVMPHLVGSRVTVNGLILPAAAPDATGPYDALFRRTEGPLEGYFREKVIGGPGAFVMSVDPETGFEEAILRKLVVEVAWNGTGGR